MENSLKKLLGLQDEGKRIYRFVSGEVTQDEYSYCQALDQLLFGEGGYIETLGSTWSLVSDPRFSRIENAFIINRRAVFGGDAKQGKQYISSDGTFTSTIADLEQYSETLGEGRYFLYILTHPDANCPVRKWQCRIFTDMMRGIEIPTPSEGLVCDCASHFEFDNNFFHTYGQIDPKTLKDQPDETLWALIKQECPNYFSKEGKPNSIANRLFDLFRADLVGLIADYAVNPISDVEVELDSGDVFNQPIGGDKWSGDKLVPRVFLEVDILEKALTQRAVLRATAAKILRQIKFQKTLKTMGDIKLTDIERDQLLRLVYTPPVVSGIKMDPGTNWYGYLHAIEPVIEKFLKEVQTGGTYEEREHIQLSRASEKAMATAAGLQDGSVLPINQFTEPAIEVEQDEYTKMMAEILKNPLKQELFMVWTDAEHRGQVGKTDEDKLKMRKLASMLTPVFSSSDYELTDEGFNQLMTDAHDLGYFTVGHTEVVENL